MSSLPRLEKFMLRRLETKTPISEEDTRFTYIITGLTEQEFIEKMRFYLVQAGARRVELIPLKSPIGRVEQKMIGTNNYFLKQFNSILRENMISTWYPVVEYRVVEKIPIYFVREPGRVTTLTKRLYLFIKQVIGDLGTPEEDYLNELDNIVRKVYGYRLDELMRITEFYSAVYFAWRDLYKYDAITVPFLDPDVEEVALFEGRIQVADNYIMNRLKEEMDFILTNLGLPPDVPEYDEIDRLTDLTKLVSSLTGRSPTIANPMVEGRILEKTEHGFVYHRLSSYLKEPGIGPGFSIRKFPDPTSRPSAAKMIRDGVVNPLIVSYALFQLIDRKFVMIIGKTGSGKTTLLQAILSLVPSTFKIYVAEDTPEIQTPSYNLERLYTRYAPEGSGLENIDLDKLGRKALRHRPTIIVIGEVRGKEISALLQVAASGHGASTTFHASTPFEVFARIIALGVHPSQLNLVKSILYINKTFLVRKIGGELKRINVRRVSSVYEITDTEKLGRSEEIARQGYKEVFKWIPERDIIVPTYDHRMSWKTKAKHLAYLWYESKTVKEMGKDRHGDEMAPRILMEIGSYAEFLSRISYGAKSDAELDIIRVFRESSNYFFNRSRYESWYWRRIAPYLKELIKGDYSPETWRV